MTPPSKIIAVVGATGNQGSSVVRTFTALPGWHVRALTRDVTSAKARALADLGAEMVAADLDDQDSLFSALEGAHAIFLLTDFWAPYMTALAGGEDRVTSSTYGFQVEIRHSRNAAEAAARVPTLERLVYSALGPMKEASNGKFCHSYHWESKNAAVNIIEREYPSLAAKTSFFYPAAYATNPFFLPKLEADTGDYAMVLPCSDEMRMPFINIERSTGPLVRALIEEEDAGTKLFAYDEIVTMKRARDIWSNVTGVEARFQRMTMQEMHDKTGVPFEVLDGAGFLAEHHFMDGIQGWTDMLGLKAKFEGQKYQEFLQTTSRDYLLKGQYPIF